MKKCMKLSELVLDFEFEEATELAASYWVGPWKEAWGPEPANRQPDHEFPE